MDDTDVEALGRLIAEEDGAAYEADKVVFDVRARAAMLALDQSKLAVQPKRAQASNLPELKPYRSRHSGKSTAAQAVAAAQGVAAIPASTVSAHTFETAQALAAMGKAGGVSLQQAIAPGPPPPAPHSTHTVPVGDGRIVEVEGLLDVTWNADPAYVLVNSKSGAILADNRTSNFGDHPKRWRITEIIRHHAAPRRGMVSALAGMFGDAIFGPNVDTTSVVVEPPPNLAGASPAMQVTVLHSTTLDVAGRPVMVMFSDADP